MTIFRANTRRSRVGMALRAVRRASGARRRVGYALHQAAPSASLRSPRTALSAVPTAAPQPVAAPLRTRQSPPPSRGSASGCRRSSGSSGTARRSAPAVPPAAPWSRGQRRENRRPETARPSTRAPFSSSGKSSACPPAAPPASRQTTPTPSPAPPSNNPTPRVSAPGPRWKNRAVLPDANARPSPGTAARRCRYSAESPAR